MYTTFYYSSSKFSKFSQGKSPLLQQLASVSLLKEKSKICLKLIELLFFSECFQSAHPLKHSLAESIFLSRVRKKQRQKSSLAEKFVSRVILQPRYHCICICKLSYPSCNAHAPYCHLWPVQLYNICSHLLINDKNFEKLYSTQNVCFDFLYKFCL